MNEGPALRRRRLGLQLRRLREARSLTGDEAGRAIDRSASWISRVETGRMALRPRDLRDLLDLYEVSDPAVRRGFESLIEGGRERGWWSKYANVIPEPYSIYIGLEDNASIVQEYDNTVFPGLLQTAEYARAIFRASILNFDQQGIDDRTAVRVLRQEILRRPNRPQLEAVLDEAVLDHAIGGPEVMVHQLEHVAELGRTTDTSIRVIPHDKVVPTAAVGPFVILRFATDDPVIVHIEGPTGGVFEEGEGTRVYESLFARLSEIAVSRDGSIDMILQARERFARRRAG